VLSSGQLERGFSLISLGIVFILMSFVPLYSFLPSSLYWEARPYVSNGQDLNQNLGFLIAGSYVKLNVYAYGGDAQISAQVLTVGQDNITKEDVIDGSGVISFGVPNSDYYSLFLRNAYQSSYQNDKQILVKVYYYFWNLVLLTSGIVLSFSGFGLTLYYELKNRAKGKLTYPPAP